MRPSSIFRCLRVAHWHLVELMDESKKILIVNADDLGCSSAVNRGIAIAHEMGIVTSASLMVRRHAADEAAAYSREHPKLSIGLHVDLGEWAFRNGAWEAIEEVPGPGEEELRRQLASFRVLMGRDPTHLDSHQHVHRQNSVGSAFLDVARELGTPLRGCDLRVRYCGDFYGQTSKGEPVHEAISVQALLGLLASLPVGVTELGCHPGVWPDTESVYGRERALEMQTLCDPRIRSAISANRIELRSFADLTT